MVFDVRGNKCRVIALVNYEIETIVITDVLTHKDYEKGGWK